MFGVEKASRLAFGALNGVTTRLATVADIAGRTSFALGGIAAALTVGALAISKYVSSAAQFQQVLNQLRQVTKGQEDLIATEKELFKVAQQSRGSLTSTIEMYSRIARSTKDLNLSSAELLVVTGNVNRAIALSGASTISAEAALVQFGQGLAANALRGQELNSVMEQTPRLARAIADGIGEAGISLAELRELAKTGGLTAEVAVKAILSQSEKLRQEFDTLPLTLAQSFTMLNNSFTQVIGDMDQANGATLRLANGIAFLSSNLGGIISVLGNVAAAAAAIGFGLLAQSAIRLIPTIGLLSAAYTVNTAAAAGASAATLGFGTASLVAATRVGVLSAAVGILRGAFALLLANPLAAAFTVIAGAVIYFTTRMSEAQKVMTEHNEVMETTSSIYQELVYAQGKRREQLIEEARAQITATEASIADLEAKREQLRVNLELAASYESQLGFFGKLIDKVNFWRSSQAELRKDLSENEKATDLLTGRLGSLVRQFDTFSTKNAVDQLTNYNDVQKRTISLNDQLIEKGEKLLDQNQRPDEKLAALKADMKMLQENNKLRAEEIRLTGKSNINDTTRAQEGIRREIDNIGTSAKRTKPAVNDLRKELDSLIESTRTPLETRDNTIANLERLRKTAARTPQDLEAIRRGIEKANEEYTKSLQEVSKELEQDNPMKEVLEDTARSIRSSFRDMFKDVFNDGGFSFKKLADRIKDMFTDLLADMAVLAISKPIIVPIVQSIGGGLGLDPATIGGVTRQFGGDASGQGPGLLSSLGNAASSAYSLLSGGGFASTGIGASLDAFGAANLGLANVSSSFVGPLQAGMTAGPTLSGLLGSAGMGAGIGSLTSMLTGGSSVGGAVGGAAGALIGNLILPGVGGFIGSALGGALGGLFGKSKPSSKLQTGDVDLSAGSRGNIINRTGLGGTDPNNPGKKFSQQNYDAVTTLGQFANQFAQSIGGLNQKLNIRVGDGGRFQYAFNDEVEKSAGSTTAEFLKTITKQIAERSGEVSQAFIGALDKIDFTDMENAIKDLNFAIVYERFTFAADASTELEKAMKELDRQFEEAAATARRLGLAESKIAEARDRQKEYLKSAFNSEVGLSILGFEDPTSLKVLQLNKEFETVRRNAYAVGGDLAAVEKLYGLRRQEILKESLQAVEDQQRAIQDTLEKSLLDIQKIRDSLALDKTLGGLNRLGRADAAQSQFDRLRGRVASGDITALQDLNSTTQDYLNASLDYYGPTEQYLSRLEDVYKLLDKADALAQGQANTDLQILSQNQAQTALLQELVNKAEAAKTDILKLSNISTAKLLRPGENASALTKVNSLNGINEQLIRAMKYVASDGRFDFSNPALASTNFADFVKNGNASAGNRFLDLLSSFGGQGIAEQRKLFGFARGTGNRRFSGMAMVGENGPELVNFGQPAQIFSNGQSSEIANDNTTAAQLDKYRKQSAKETAMMVEQLQLIADKVDELSKQTAVSNRT